MKSLRANVSRVDAAERRDDHRWHVELLVKVGPQSADRVASVRNLSEKGMMLETDLELKIGETVQVSLPGGDETEACIVWRQDQAYGCEFLSRISTSVISAAILQAPVEGSSEGEGDPRFEEIPIGIRPTMDDLSAWRAKFQETHGLAGQKLVAFRQTDGGLMIAIVTAATAA